jgi:cobyrinic acid a,c-diamide synthase
MNWSRQLAIGTVQPGADRHVFTWALLQALTDAGVQVQSFYSQGHFIQRDGSYTITGLRRRYLDSWLMRPEVCADLFRRGMQGADLGLVDGVFDASYQGPAAGGSLDQLASLLDLPCLVIVDAERLPTGRLLQFPSRTAGLLLDNVGTVEQLCRLQTTLESLYGVPVLGSLERLGCLRAIAGRSACGALPTSELCQALGRALVRRLDVDRILRLAERALPAVSCEAFPADLAVRDLHVAVALDEAFSCYFPDTLDALERQGARVSVFSPLSSDRLPRDVDVVYFGCGRPEYYLRALASNVCLKEAIWAYMQAGGCIYAESGGMAYLAQEIVMPCGRHWPMVGVLPAAARLCPHDQAPSPAELTLAADSWLYRRSQRVRGYLNDRWRLLPAAGLQPLADERAHRFALAGSHRVIGSALHVHFAAQPELLRQFAARGRLSRPGSIA